MRTDTGENANNSCFTGDYCSAHVFSFACTRVESDQINLNNASSTSSTHLLFFTTLGHNGDHGAKMSDIVLPGAAYTEKHATYVNLEGRAQRTYPAVAPPGDARQDWAILRAISEVAGCPLPYDNLEGVRQRMHQIAPGLLEIDAVQGADQACLKVAAADAKVSLGFLLFPLPSWYCSDTVQPHIKIDCFADVGRNPALLSKYCYSLMGG